MIYLFFFFNDTATTEIYTLSLHDALPISVELDACVDRVARGARDRRHDHALLAQQLVEQRRLADVGASDQGQPGRLLRSEEHTSELQSRQYLVCRLLLEKKKKNHHETIL